jgi:hypothetical protein
MHRLKQGMAAGVLVMSLGLIVPASFGGLASADVNSSRGHNTHTLSEPYSFDCDLVGGGIYETKYDLASTNNAQARQVQGSNLVVQRRLWVDVIDSFYTVINNPTGGTATTVYDPDVYWFNGPESYPQGGGQPKGWTTVRCTSVTTDKYTATADDVALGLGFVEGVTYLETDTKLYDVTLSQGGQQLKAASVDDSPGAHRTHKGKNGGKHHTKGKHGR